jgi:hypothetical protein
MQDNVPRMVFLLYEYKGEPANPTCRPDSVFPVTKHYARSLNCPPSSHRLPFLPLCRPLTAIHRRVLVHVSLSLFFAELGGLNIIISIVVPIGMKWDHWLDHWPALRLHHVLYQLWLQYYNSLFDLWYSLVLGYSRGRTQREVYFWFIGGSSGLPLGLRLWGEWSAERSIDHAHWHSFLHLFLLLSLPEPCHSPHRFAPLYRIYDRRLIGRHVAGPVRSSARLI